MAYVCCNIDSYRPTDSRRHWPVICVGQEDKIVGYTRLAYAALTVKAQATGIDI